MKETASKIVESIPYKLRDNDINIFDILSNAYFKYKELLQIIKELMVCKKYFNDSKKKKITPKNPPKKAGVNNNINKEIKIEKNENNDSNPEKSNMKTDSNTIKKGRRKDKRKKGISIS